MIQLHLFKNAFFLKRYETEIVIIFYSDIFKQNMIRLMMHENLQPPVI